MITCHVEYVIDPYKLSEFEHYAIMWIRLIRRYGGIHHGYFLPYEGPNNIAYALFSFGSLASYAAYRTKVADDPECHAALDYAVDTRCVKSYKRSFTRPIFDYQ